MKDRHRETIVANQKLPRLLHRASLSSGTGENHASVFRALSVTFSLVNGDLS